MNISQGVTIKNERVINLDLCGNNLNGTIPVEFYTLSGLERFSFCDEKKNHLILDL